MRERDETILFSAIAILLAVLTLGGLTGRALPDARAAAKERQIQIAPVATCTSSAAAPSLGSKIDHHG